MRLAAISPWGWLSFAAAFNALLPAAHKAYQEEGLIASITSGLGHSFVIWFSLIIVYRLAVRDRTPSAEKTLLLPVYLVICLALMLPWAQLSWVCCAVAAWIWRSLASPQSASRTAAIVMFAVAIREPGTQICLTLFADQILNIDATLATSLLGLFSSAAEVESNIIKPDGGFSLMILTGCSAFGNLSLALLLWISLTLNLHLQMTPHDVIRAAVVISIVLLINSLRLAGMSLSEDWYNSLHTGLGAEIVNSLVLITPLLLVRWNKDNEHQTLLSNFSTARALHRPINKGL